MRARTLAILSLLLAVPAFASIRGTAMARDGAPIAGAKVSIFALSPADASRVRLLSKSPDRTALATATTDSKGAFVLESPKDPVVALQIDARGYAPAGQHVEREDDTVVLALTAAPVKQGTVSANGKAVAGATVVWFGNAVEIIATTDASGKYSIPDPVKWASRVFVIHPDFAIADEAFGVQRKPDANFTLETGVAVSGKILNGAAPVGKASVYADRWPVATTADDGTFAIAHAPRTFETIDGSSGELSATAARSKGAVTLKLAPASGVSGVLRDAKTQAFIAGAELLFMQSMGRGLRTSAASAITDAKGAFSVNIRPGVYDITCSHPSYSAQVSNISVTPRQRIQKNIAASAKARVTGTVIDDQKRAVAAATISIDQADTGGMRGLRRAQMLGRAAFDAVSGPDGRFTLRTNEEGEVELSATKRGLPDAKTAVFKLSSGDRKTGVTITIPRGIALTGRVVDHDRKPLSGVAVVAIDGDAGGGNRPGGAMVRRVILNVVSSPEDPVLTGTDGTFSIVLKEGTYDVKFAREGFAAKTLRGEQVSASAKPLEVTLDPGVEITGRVTRSGNGIENVSVIAIDTESRAMAVTGSDGRFTLSDLTPGSHMVMVAKADDFVDVRKTITAPARDVAIDLPPGGRIAGHVIDKSGRQPVTSFQAGVNRSRSGGGFQIMMPPVIRSFTADDGTFVIDNVPTGTMELIVSAPGFTTAHVPNITVEEGKTGPEVEVVLETGVRLTGRVTAQDSSPLSGVAVRANTGGGGMRIPAMPGDTSATTDANGEYSIDQLDAGDNKSFQFARTGYLPETRTVTLSGKETRLDVRLSSGMTISGAVVTEGGVPVPDAEVQAMSAAAGSIPRTTKTDAAGTFVLDAIAPGRYTMTASKSGLAEGVLRDFDVTAGGSPRIVMKSGGTLTGHVSGVADADLSKVSVTARSSAGSAESTVDAGGNYRIDGAPTGTVRVNAMLMRGIGDVRTTDTTSVNLDPGGAATADLVFTSGTVIRGRITSNGTPAANTTVQFAPRSGTVQTRSGGNTDDNGIYSVTGLADGDYNVIVIDMQRLSPYSTTYSVHGSGTFDIDMRTTPLRGHVVDRGDSSPIGSARIQLRQKNSAQQGPMAVLSATSDDSGAFVFDSVAAGTYTLSADKDGYGNNVKDVVVNDSNTSDVMVDLMRNDATTLKVVDGRDGTLLNAYITVFDAQNRQVYSTGGGRFGGSDSARIPLSPGQYRASVSASGYAGKTISFVSPSVQTVALTPGGTLILRSTSAAVRRGVLLDAGGSPYLRPFASDPSFPIAPGESRIQNVVPGRYTLQVLGANGAVAVTKTIVVVEGQEIGVDI